MLSCYSVPFRPKPSGLASLFGALELRVLDAMWRRGGEMSVRDLQSAFPSSAYTTLMTTMDRLHRKGVLARRKLGRAFVYRVVSSREELESGLVTRALQPLLQGANAEPILSFFVEEVSRQDDRLLDELERLVREKRHRQTQTNTAGPGKRDGGR
jgi:predicted transcriptional regulator